MLADKWGTASSSYHWGEYAQWLGCLCGKPPFGPVRTTAARPPLSLYTWHMANKWWIIDAGSPDSMSGEKAGLIQAPTEELARQRYLGGRPEDWVIFAIEETKKPAKQEEFVPSEPIQYASSE